MGQNAIWGSGVQLKMPQTPHFGSCQLAHEGTEPPSTIGRQFQLPTRPVSRGPGTQKAQDTSELLRPDGRTDRGVPRLHAPGDTRCERCAHDACVQTISHVCCRNCADSTSQPEAPMCKGKLPHWIGLGHGQEGQPHTAKCGHRVREQRDPSPKGDRHGDSRSLGKLHRRGGATRNSRNAVVQQPVGVNSRLEPRIFQIAEPELRLCLGPPACSFKQCGVTRWLESATVVANSLRL